MIAMTQAECFEQLQTQLEKAGCDSPAFDAICLLEDLSGLPHGRRPDDTELTSTQQAAVLAAADRRAAGEPLQYILGCWDFLTLTLDVGAGVLIPRPETELLCETGAAFLSIRKGATALDLCAGSGCVALGLCSLQENVHVTAVELSGDALPYLQRNVARYPQYAVAPVCDDVLA
ncbi:MAG: peptide chain release factor N(5)-glutamine methyltransferase, partial [Clostridia bacterium]|nr:peptide chain release factor N(5)-glutamine methyltransferase [Clostridia bacterium]